MAKRSLMFPVNQSRCTGNTFTKKNRLQSLDPRCKALTQKIVPDHLRRDVSWL